MKYLKFLPHVDILPMEFDPLLFVRKTTLFDISQCLPLIVDKITILIEIPVIQWLIIEIHSRRFGVRKVSKPLAPNIFAVFGSIDYFGVKRQRSICRRDHARFEGQMSKPTPTP